MDYRNKSIPWLVKTLVRHFNKFIRERDQDERCISCGQFSRLEAGHYYPSTVSGLRFTENNVNGQCKRCNRHLHGNLIEYRRGLVEKIGLEEVEWLELQYSYYKKHGFKWNRFELIEKIEKYKNVNRIN